MKALEKTYDVPLHDIKTIVEVNEYSLYYLIGVSSIAFILIGGLVYLIYKWYVKRNLYSQRKEHYRLLHSIDLNDTKKAAYAISLYGATFVNDGDRQAGMYQNITQRLEQFKYKKDVDKFDKETLGYIELYKGMIDV